MATVNAIAQETITIVSLPVLLDLRIQSLGPHRPLPKTIHLHPLLDTCVHTKTSVRSQFLNERSQTHL